MRRIVGLTVGALALAVTLVACAGGTPDFEQVKGLPTGLPAASIAPEDVGQPMAFANDGELVVVVWGSSSCRPAPTDFDTSGPVATITFAADSKGATACTADLAPTSYVIPGSVFGGSVPAKIVLVVDRSRSTVTVVK